MQKKKICHLTLLNPALHSRIFFKEARSQAGAGYSVTIIGRDEATEPYMVDDIRIIPLASFSRISTERYATTQKLLGLAIEEKADLYHVHSPELLGIAKKVKRALPQAKIVYDMHEDYQKNIKFGGYYSPLLKDSLSQWVRTRERRFLKWGDGVIYAEECFDDILKAGDRKVVIANKFKLPPAIPPHSDTGAGGESTSTPDLGADQGDSPAHDTAQAEQSGGEAAPGIPEQQPATEQKGQAISQTAAPKRAKARKAAPQAEATHPILLYTGTIAQPWGILSTLELWSALNEYLPVQLIVAGHSHNHKLVTSVEKFVAISGIKERFRMEGGTEYLPFERIVELIDQCTLGTAFYEPRENIRDRIPTKFYEFMARKKPLLFTQNPAWNALNDKWHFGKPMQLPMREETIQQAVEYIQRPEEFFYPKPVPEEAYAWKFEEQKLIDFTRSLF